MLTTVRRNALTFLFSVLALFPLLVQAQGTISGTVTLQSVVNAQQPISFDLTPTGSGGGRLPDHYAFFFRCI